MTSKAFKILFVAAAVIPTTVLWWNDQAITQKLQCKITQLESDAQKQTVDYQKLNRQAQELRRDMAVLQEAFQKASIRAENGTQAWRKLEQATHTFANGETISAKELVSAKRAFDDIQGEVASGKLRELAQMDAYQTLKKVLDSPAVESLASLEPERN